MGLREKKLSFNIIKKDTITVTHKKQCLFGCSFLIGTENQFHKKKTNHKKFHFLSLNYILVVIHYQDSEKNKKLKLIPFLDSTGLNFIAFFNTGWHSALHITRFSFF